MATTVPPLSAYGSNFPLSSEDSTSLNTKSAECLAPPEATATHSSKMIRGANILRNSGSLGIWDVFDRWLSFFFVSFFHNSQSTATALNSDPDMEVLQHVTAAMDRGLQQLHRKEETVKRAPPHFPPAAAEMEGLMADLQQELEFVRQEKVWKAFNLQEAESNYQTISGKYPACFAVTVGWYQMEVHVLNWILSPSHQLLRGIVAMCDSLQRKASQFLKEVKQLGDAEVYLVYGLECRILRAELQMMQAFADFMKKNAMAAAHTLLGVYNHCKDTAVALQDCEDRVALKDQFTRYCESSTSLTQLLDTDHISPELLASLAGMIEAKTLDIRRMHLDRRAEVSEEVLNATRDLLRLKQLYRDLSGKWKSSDGHHDTSNAAEEPSPPQPQTVAVLKESVLTTPVKQQCSRPFPISLTTPEKLSFSDGLDDMDKENEGAQSPVAAESPRAKRVQLPITVITPKKQSLSTIKMVLPRLSDLTKLWEAAPALDVPIKPRHRGSGARKSSIKTNPTVHTTTSNSSASNSPHSFFGDAVGIQEAWQRAGDCFLLRATASLRARLEMINALFNIGVATVPDSLSWVLAILNVSASSASGLSSLFALHRVEQSRWSAAATLLLMNMPMEIVERAFDEPHGPGVVLPGNCAARFHAVIEAQALMLPWTASHPLWLASLARSTHHYSEINANLHTKLDHLRRALRSERYLLRGKAAQQTEECFFWIRFDMVKQFMGIGHWMQAISASRDLLGSLRDDSILKRFGTISLIAATAALVNAEEFVTQTKYMQLKFDDRIILNGGSNGKNQASMTRKARTASFSSAQNLSADRNRHLLQIVTRAFTHVKGSISTSVGDSACLRMFLGVSYVSNTSTYNSRTAQYMQTHELLERMHAEDFDQHAAADIVMEEFLLHWCFLLPLEMVYLFQRSEGNDHEVSALTTGVVFVSLICITGRACTVIADC